MSHYRLTLAEYNLAKCVIIASEILERFQMTKILLLPGLLCDAQFYAAQSTALAQNFEIITADYGEADTLQEMAKIALAAVEGDFMLVGHSMGGRVALEIMRIASNRVLKLALLNTGIHPRAEGELPKRQAMIDLGNNEGMLALAQKWLPPMVSPSRLDDKDLFAQMTQMVLRKNPKIHENQIMALVNRPDVEDVLVQINCKTLVMTGSDDLWSPPSQHEIIASKIKGSELKIISGSGHMSCMEKPNETSKVLLDWAMA